MTTTDAATADTTGAASLSVAAVAIEENCHLYTSIIDFTYSIGTIQLQFQNHHHLVMYPLDCTGELPLINFMLVIICWYSMVRISDKL